MHRLYKIKHRALSSVFTLVLIPSYTILSKTMITFSSRARAFFATEKSRTHGQGPKRQGPQIFNGKGSPRSGSGV